MHVWGLTDLPAKVPAAAGPALFHPKHTFLPLHAPCTSCSGLPSRAWHTVDPDPSCLMGKPFHRRGTVSLAHQWVFFFLFFFLWLLSFRAASAACGGSQARGPIRAVAAGLHHSHSNARSELHLRPTPQFMATPDPQPTEQGQGSNTQPHGSQSDFYPLTGTPYYYFFYFQGCTCGIWKFPGQGSNWRCSCQAAPQQLTPDLSHICDLHLSSLQCWILSPLSEARDGTHILVDTGWVHYH